MKIVANRLDTDRTFELDAMVLGGEKTKVDRFNGGNKTETVVIVNNTGETVAETGSMADTDPKEGDAIEVTTVTFVADTEDNLPDRTTSSVWHFDLSQVVRDRHSNAQTSVGPIAGVGAINQADVEVVVDGEILDYGNSEFQLDWVANLAQGCTTPET